MSRTVVLLALGTSVPVGCGPSTGTIRTDRPWPWWPASMDMSSLTRVGRVGPDGRRPIEVRLLFKDPDGDPCKASGELILTIARVGEPEDPEEREIDLADLDVQRRYFEVVTGCYAIPIELDLPGLIPGRMLRIEADFEGVDGARFQAQRDLVLDQAIRSAE